MRTIIHDLNDKDINKFKFNYDDKLISAVNCNNGCIGCFSCWIKTPRECAFKDNYSKMTEFLKDSDELIIISKCRYGCYSNQTKRVLERCIGYVLPYFTIREGRIHHKSRYNKKIKLKAYFYGNIKKIEKESLYDLVKANSINLNASSFEVNCVDNLRELKKCIH